MKSLEQLKIDAKNSGWPWKIDHPNDERALLDGCYPDFQAAERVRRYYKKLLRVPSPTGGTMPFHLLDWWYRDVLAQLFGWKRRDGRRRFQKGFVTTSKKSGKSTVLSGLCSYMCCADNEDEAEAYSTAVDRDQAKIIFQKVVRSIRLSPHMSQIFRIVESQNKIWHDRSGSKYEAISSDADSTEGKNPHLLVADELHVWRDRQFFSSLMYGDIVRAQPLFLMITTAGEDEFCIGYEEYEAAKALLDPNDPYYVESTFAYIAEAKDEAKWDEPQSWLEASPSLRGEVDYERPRDLDDPPAEPVKLGSIEKLADKAKEARQMPARKREFIRYICNRWVFNATDPYIEVESWDACEGDVKWIDGEQVYLALDLAQTDDLIALCRAGFDGDKIKMSWQFWTPEETVERHQDQWKVPLRQWIADGYIHSVPGRSVPYSFVRRVVSGFNCDEQGAVLPYDVTAEAKRFELCELSIDPWNAQELATNLAETDSLCVNKFSQSISMMNAPTKGLREFVAQSKIVHNGGPVLRWMIRNTVCPADANENIRPIKRKSTGKIDGVVAGIMAAWRARTANANGQAFFVTG